MSNHRRLQIVKQAANCNQLKPEFNQKPFLHETLTFIAYTNALSIR